MKTKILLGPLVGGLSHNRANIWARADSKAVMHAWLATRPNASDADWIGSADLPEIDGCAGVVKLTRLKAETCYFYAVSLQKKKPSQGEFHSFTTFPKPGTKASFNFVFGSCYRPSDKPGEPAESSMDALRARLGPDALRFGLLIGDQIYADARGYNGLDRVAVTIDDYRKVYEHNWSRPPMQALLPNLPWFMTLDDHEVDNDWRWRDKERRWADPSILDRFLRWLNGRPPQEIHLLPERVRAALKAYHEHQGIHAPKMLLPLDTDAKGEFLFHPEHPGSLAYTFYFGNAAFFVLDTRTMRVGGRHRSMLGEGQWHALEEWLKDINQKYTVKFLVTSCSILHPLWFDFARDRWSGFPAERARLLRLLAESEIEGLRILTGDLHAGHAVTAELKSPSGKRIPIVEVCGSPFEQKCHNLKFGYWPLLSKWLTFPRRRFYHARPNFVTVKVNFESPEPAVVFTLHYNENGWKTEPLTA